VKEGGTRQERMRETKAERKEEWEWEKNRETWSERESGYHS